MASQFRKLLEAVAANPDGEIPELLRSAGIDPAVRAQQASQPSLIHKKAPAATLGLIPRRADTAAADLSLIQERMWFLQQLEPESSAFNRPKAWRLRGTLDVEILANAVNEIVRRHEILRLAVALAEGKPKPILVPELFLSVPVSDLKELPETNRELEATRVAEDEGRRPFDLAKPPLFRIRLIQLSDEDCILQFTFHHIISDAWSDGVFWRELGTIYDALADGRAPQLPELPIQYSDFARWQRQLLNEKKFEQHFSFWKEKLSDEAPLVSLPLDRPRPAFITPRGDRQSVMIDPVLTESLKSLSRREGVTLFTTLLAAFNTLLFRYTGQEDLLVGSPVAGRTRRELEGLIGPLLRTLVLRTDLSGNPRFRELLSRVGRVTLEALEHQDLPFERLLETLRPERALSHSPIFQVLFNFRNVPTETLSLTGVTTRELSIETRDAFFDIDFDLEERNGALQCVARYQEDLFDPDTISGFLRHFRTLLEGIVSAPETRIQDLPLVAAEIEGQILEEWQQVRNSPATAICVHHRFEAQAHRTPEAQAVCFEDRWLTYRELNDRANRLAHRLQHLGVRPETRVGLFMQRSPEMIVGIFGVLIAGGAYVPLDPAYPEARLAFMIKDAQLTLILTQQALLARLEDHSWQHIPSDDGSPFKMPPSIVVDREGQQIAMESRRSPGSSVCPDNLAYVIYTSGSTGNPKGVMVSHRALARCIENVGSVYGIEARDRVLQFASISFDLSVEEIFTPLTHGATLVLRSESMFDSVKEFLEQCRLLSITVLDLPTAYWHQLASALEPGIPDFPGCLRLVVIGGERALPDRVVLWGKRGPGWVRLVNSYGPTEATITATTCELKPGTTEGRPLGEVPIGRPLAHVVAWVLDSRLRPVPEGVVGELYLGGDSLARGYLNRADLSAERFGPNPYGEPGTRLYQTGDRVRRMRNGELIFLGRTDNQVKVRGFRIEPEEVEAALNLHPAVRSCAVVARLDPTHNTQLVAFVIPQGGAAIASADLRRFLQERLPDYMVPGSISFLDVLPITPAGKVNRRALEESRPDKTRQEPYVAPRTPLEKTLAGIWMSLLNLNVIGIHSNFFDLGGHSLLATQVVARIQRVLGVDLPLRRLFETPTVAELALAIVEKQAEQVGETALNKMLAELEEANPRLEDSADQTA